MTDEREPGETEGADEETTVPAAPETPPAEAPHDADVVRLYVRDADATAIGCAAGSATVTDGCIEVPVADVERWLTGSNGIVTRENPRA